MGLHVTNAEGAEITPIMGSYGIGMERILSTAIELYHDDKDGMILPAAIAPFTRVTPVNMADAAQQQAADQIYRACLGLGLDALLDARDEWPGVKFKVRFKDADLIGVPYRITVGKKAAAGTVVLVERRSRKIVDLPIAEAAGHLAEQLAEQVKEHHGG
jgi:prolyl-tRNA synthetase